jgi:Protein of unknown function (DUF3102)
MPPRKAAGPKRDRSARGARREDQLGRQVGAEAKTTKLKLQVDLVLQEYATEIRTLARKSVQDVIRIGELLTKVQKRVEHGGWLPWLERELGWSDDSARNYMAVHRLSQKPKFRKFRHFWHRLAPSVLYVLAREGVSDEIFDEVMERAAAGEKITPAAAKKFITVTVTNTGQVVYPMYRKDSDLPKSSPPTLGLPFARSSQQGEPTTEPGSVPSTGTVPSEPLRRAPVPPGRDEDRPQITEKEINRARVDGGAERLIDEVVRSGSDVREKAVELVLGERAHDYDAFAQAVRELALRLDRASAARGAANLRLIADDPEAPR